MVGPLEADAYYEAFGSDTQLQAEGEAANPPVIDRFTIDSMGDYWMVSGHVTDDQIWTSGHVIRFGGVLQGKEIYPTLSGDFSLFLMMPPGASGEASAVAMDNTGLLSQVVYATV